MGNTNQEKVINFINAADKCISENGYDPGTVGNLNTFLKFFSAKQKPIDEYTVEDFKEFARENYRVPTSFASVKTRIKTLLRTMGENEAAEVLDDTEIACSTNYIRDFSALCKGIEDTRFSDMPFLKYTPESDQCDKLTMGEVILYLAWIGVPQKAVFELPLTAIDLDKNVVSGGREYSFAEYPQIVKVFTRYKNSDTFVGTRTVNGKIHFVTSEYYGDTLIRAKKQNNNNINIRTLLARVFSAFSFAGSYLNVCRSGQFYRGYQKYLKGEMPDFRSPGKYENIWKYFGIALTTEEQIQSFKKSWLIYLDWQESQK